MLQLMDFYWILFICIISYETINVLFPQNTTYLFLEKRDYLIWKLIILFQFLFKNHWKEI